MTRRAPAKVFLLDSRDDVRDTYADALRSARLEVTILSEVDRALQLVKGTAPQIVLVGSDATTHK